MSRRLRCPACKSPNLQVDVRHGNYSAFSGYRFTPSRYSAVSCKDCLTPWRTKSPMVDELPDAPAPRARKDAAP